jgi:hypothetical protein
MLEFEFHQSVSLPHTTFSRMVCDSRGGCGKMQSGFRFRALSRAVPMTERCFSHGWQLNIGGCRIRMSPAVHAGQV